jgi:L-threonylcarbamoyladenylate synthase
MDWAKHFKIRQAAQWVALGEVIAYPTEAVWGLGCDPFNEYAVEKIVDLKGRPLSKGVLLIAASVEQVEPFLHQLTTEQRTRLATPRPHATTWVVPDTLIAPPWIRGQFPTVALRITQHPLAAGLCRAVGGPLVSTSANPSGKAPARNALTVRRYFKEGITVITPGQVGTAQRPSEIRDIVSGHIMRAG